MTSRKPAKRRLKGKVRVTEQVHSKGRVYHNLMDDKGKVKTRRVK
jgi:hypothetical protein